MWWNGSSHGENGSRIAGMPVADSAPRVAPW